MWNDLKEVMIEHILIVECWNEYGNKDGGGTDWRTQKKEKKRAYKKKNSKSMEKTLIKFLSSMIWRTVIMMFE